MLDLQELLGGECRGRWKASASAACVIHRVCLQFHVPHPVFKSVVVVGVTVVMILVVMMTKHRVFTVHQALCLVLCMQFFIEWEGHGIQMSS